MAQIIDKIIRQTNAPNNTNVMWDNGEQLFINRNGSWQSVGGSSNGGSDVVTKAVDLELLVENSKYTKKLYDFVKTSHINGICVKYEAAEGLNIIPPISPGIMCGFTMYYFEEDDLVCFMIVQEMSDTFSIMAATFGPSTEYNIIFEDLFGTGSTIIAGSTYLQLLTTEGSVNNNFFASLVVAGALFNDFIYYSPEYTCILYRSNYAFRENMSFFGFTEDNKILKIEVETATGKTVSSTLFDLNSLITTA